MAIPETYTLPDDCLLARLLAAAKQYPKEEPFVTDAYGFSKTYGHLLADLLHARRLLRSTLPANILDEHGLLRDDRPYICVLAPSGYEFYVACLAIRAVGGACIPFASGILPEEADEFMTMSQSSCLMASRGLTQQAERIVTRRAEHGTGPVTVALPITCDQEPMSLDGVSIDKSRTLDPLGPGFAVFTSGTTGRSKAAALPRCCFDDSKLVPLGSASLVPRPPHWVGGLIGLMKCVLTGARAYTTKDRVTAEELWGLFRDHHITDAMLSPILLRKMMEHWNDHICQLNEGERDAYLRGFKNLDCIASGSSMLTPSVLQFWKDLTGLPYENRYGMTECTHPLQPVRDSKIQYSLGIPYPGVKAKLSKGDHGELLLKSPQMLTHYIGNEDATRAAFDKDGYYRTGDEAKLVEGEYVLTGRTTTDYVYYQGIRIPTLQVEVGLSNLPYIAEAVVLGIPHHESTEVCSALVRLKKPGTQAASATGVSNGDASTIDLAKIRADLVQDGLRAFMLPVLLRILRDDETVPLTVSFKPIKRRIRQDFFGVTDFWPMDKPTPGVECCSHVPVDDEAKVRPWDWFGRQRAD